jgi:hypothetical protein
MEGSIMRQLKGFFKVCAFVLMLTIVAPTTLPICNPVVAQAATVKLKDKKLSLEVGETYTLKITGTKAKAAWTTSKKSVATVSKEGKVTAKKAGTATITATVNKKKYTCKVTVKENPFVKKAPFDAQLVTFGDVSSVIPADWTTKVLSEQGNNFMVAIYPKGATMVNQTSNIVLVIQNTGAPKTDYKLTKAMLEQRLTAEFFTSQFAQTGITATISDFKTSDYEAKLGTAFKTEYKAQYKDTSVDKNITQKIYDLFMDNYFVEVTVTDIADGATPDVTEAGEYALNSIVVK